MLLVCPCVCVCTNCVYLFLPHQPLGEVTTLSGHCPPLDRLEQALELIQEVAARCSLQMGKHLGIVLDAEAAAFFNAVSSRGCVCMCMPIVCVHVCVW